MSLGSVVIVVVALGCSLAGRWRLQPEQRYLILFSGLGMLLPLIYPIHGIDPLRSYGRYALECLPLFMLLAKWGDNRHIERGYLLVAVPIQALLLYTFTQGGFIA